MKKSSNPRPTGSSARSQPLRYTPAEGVQEVIKEGVHREVEHCELRRQQEHEEQQRELTLQCKRMEVEMEGLELEGRKLEQDQDRFRQKEWQT